MTAEMLARLQEHKRQMLNEFIEKYSVSIAGEDPNDFTASIADFVLDEGIGYRQSLIHIWNLNWKAALAGKFPDRQQVGKRLRIMLEQGGASLAGIAASVRRGSTLSGREVARLQEFEEQVRAFPDWIEECMGKWELLDKPRKPVDRDKLARAQAAFQRGECESPADIIARLDQGGPLVKE